MNTFDRMKQMTQYFYAFAMVQCIHVGLVLIQGDQHNITRLMVPLLQLVLALAVARNAHEFKAWCWRLGAFIAPLFIALSLAIIAMSVYLLLQHGVVVLLCIEIVFAVASIMALSLAMKTLWHPALKQRYLAQVNE
ncbi:hypothetical protein VST7929_01548 [Vibrio stylophorae]|uniref:CidA/LrgA family protein n=1 Tax=Vibrio stylophorae TaxID=659351 RepID=A0ABN8DUF5_9VIBR|nr:hypothetical protein [Vibrio stylophorae]CAH0533677.1 hypothetical protein VST7929_01548 [Vibrio stylophorae]